MVFGQEKTKNRWAKNYEKEALELIRENKKKYSEMFHKNQELGARMCGAGVHKTDEDIYTCKICGGSFCRYHGDVKSGKCDICQGKGLF